MSSSTEIRADGRNRAFPHHAIIQSDLTFNFVSGDTAEEAITIDLNSLIKKVIVSVGSASGAVVAAAFTIKDKDGFTILSDSALAEGSENQYSLEEPLFGAVTIGVTPSTDPLSAFAVTIHLKGV